MGRPHSMSSRLLIWCSLDLVSIRVWFWFAQRVSLSYELWLALSLLSCCFGLVRAGSQKCNIKPTNGSVNTTLVLQGPVRNRPTEHRLHSVYRVRELQADRLPEYCQCVANTNREKNSQSSCPCPGANLSCFYLLGMEKEQQIRTGV